MANNLNNEIAPPGWAWEFHGHHCPFMPLGYRMAKLAMKELGVEHEKDHGFFVIPELGIGHPQTCLIDGIQIATGATYGKSLIEKTFWGKLAAVFYKSDKMAIRISLRPDFSDEFGKNEFFVYRKRGVEPSEIPVDVSTNAIKWMYEQADDKVFKIEKLPDYKFTPPKGSFNKVKCSKCGEYVFERYARFVDNKPYCIPCSGYNR
jgi:formylmethanofuran dehydrogenase subunit E